MTGDRQTVECATHGTCDGAWVCQHLANGEQLGFNIGYDEDHPNHQFPDAWCDACEKAWEAEGEWNEKSMAFADIKGVCSHCYVDIRARNWPQNDGVWRDLVSTCCTKFSERQNHFSNAYKLEHYDHWERDLSTGTLTFSKDGKAQVEAKFHLAGSLSLRSNTWLWAWGNEYYDDELRNASLSARYLGEEKKLLPLIAHLSDATEKDAFHYTAIMAEALDAKGYYRTLEGDMWLYMVITEASWLGRGKRLFNLWRKA